MIYTRNTMLNQRPKAFNAVGMNIPIHIDFGMVVNPLMSITNSSHSIIGGELIGIKSGITRHLLVDKGDDSVPLDIGGKRIKVFETEPADRLLVVPEVIGCSRPGTVTKRSVVLVDARGSTSKPFEVVVTCKGE